jgi:hypothetical protein
MAALCRGLPEEGHELAAGSRGQAPGGQQAAGRGPLPAGAPLRHVNLHLVRANECEHVPQVSRELDALSHFFFTPLPVPREEPGLTSLPVESLQMEDVTPVGESRAAARAPEQVAAKKSGRAAALVASEELTREDRQRLRRAAKGKAKKDKKAGAGSDSNSAARLQDQLRADKRVVLAADGGAGRAQSGSGPADRRRRQGAGGDSLSKSATFFAQLQRQTQAQIQSQSQAQAQGKKGLKRKAEAELTPSHAFKL